MSRARARAARVAERSCARDEVTPPRVSRRPNKAGHGATLAPHLGLLELGSGNRPVESGAQLLGCLQGQLNPRPRPGVKASVDKVERDDIAQRRMARVVISNHRLGEREPFGPALCHALCTCDLDDGRTHASALLLRQMLGEEGEDLAPAIHRLLGSVKRPVPIPDAVAGSVVAVKLVGLAVLLQRSLMLVHLLGARRAIFLAHHHTAAPEVSTGVYVFPLARINHGVATT